jgi:hypothetical protein
MKRENLEDVVVFIILGLIAFCIFKVYGLI